MTATVFGSDAGGSPQKAGPGVGVCFGFRRGRVDHGGENIVTHNLLDG